MLKEVTCGTRARTEEGTLEESLLGEEKKKKKEDNEQQITSNSPTAVFLHLTMVHIMKWRNNENGL